MSFPIILSIIIGLLVLGLLVFFIAWKIIKPEKIEPNYRLFFIMGITWLPIGIALDNPGLWGMGIIFMVLGLVNKNKWGEESSWSEMTMEQRRYKLFIVIGLLVLVVFGFLAFLLFRQAG
ncbi:MAG: hypothetical protein JXA42_13165 [Anaerolineales bacterium]|nr:hypothetical protein [Anaerolineales bacterium]